MEIPRQFRCPEYKFLLVGGKSKKPIEEWKKPENHLAFDNPKVIKHMEKDGNIGILGGYGGLVVIDCDRHELEDALKESLPATFMEKSAKGTHFFYKCDKVDYYQSLDIKDIDGTVTHFGEVRADREHQTVIAPSMHETGVQYVAINDAEIVDISFDMLVNALRPFLNPQINWEEEHQRIISTEKRTVTIPIELVIPTTNYRQISNGEFQGPHPTHGSTTGLNFCFNIQKQLWHCFRHNCGGTGLHLMAMLEGRLECGGQMDTILFLEMIRIAKEKYDIQVIQPRGLFRPFEDYGIPEPVTFLWDKYIPSKGICVVAGYTGVGKSLIAEEFISAITNRRKLFHHFELNTYQRPVVLIDMENDHGTLYARLNQMGGVPDRRLYAYNFDESFDMDDPTCVQELIDIVNIIDPCLVIFDTLRRTYSGDENDSKIINKVFRTALGPIAKHRCVMIVAHYRKKSNNPKSSTTDVLDDLSSIRGTGDITGIASSVILLTQNYDKSISIRSDKVRCAPKPDEIITVKIMPSDDLKELKILYAGSSENVLPTQDNTEKKLMSVIIHNFRNEPFTRKNLSVLVDSQHICKSSRLTTALKELVRMQHLFQLTHGKYQVNNSQVNISDYTEDSEDNNSEANESENNTGETEAD